MKLSIMKYVFIITIFVCWSTLSIANSIALLRANDDVKFPNFMDELLRSLCENELNSLHFNAVIPNINQDFISSPSITCLNFTNNHIENIERGAFNKLPNLTELFLSNNRLRTSELFNFGGHYKLQFLVMDSAVMNALTEIVQIVGEYPNLEVLSLRKYFFNDLYFSPEKTPLSELLSAYTTTSTIIQKSPFPKLQFLDLSENHIRQTNFLTLLPNSLYFLDLHNNLLESLDLNKIANNKLFALNLDNNYFNYITLTNNQYSFKSTLSLADLKDLRYLSVSANYIEIIERDAFQDTKKLLYLNVSKNNINYLYPGTFANLQYLKMLDLSENKLETVPQILNEIEISTLYINHNNIMRLLSHIFVQMPKLTKLLLGENQINEIDVNAFTNLSVLKELDLSRNMLSFLPEGWTEPLISLKYLDLSDNKFISLESLSLTNTLPLIEIYLMINPLENLNVRYFQSLPQNLTINLINKSSFTTWTRLRNGPLRNEEDVIDTYS